ncbi:MAG: hypothetical protein Q9223_007793 [Gallowayella weberi]
MAPLVTAAERLALIRAARNHKFSRNNLALHLLYPVLGKESAMGTKTVTKMGRENASNQRHITSNVILTITETNHPQGDYFRFKDRSVRKATSCEAKSVGSRKT